MLSAFLYSARLYAVLCLQSLHRRRDIGKLTFLGRLLRILLFIAFLPIWLMHWLCLFLDEIFFFRYRHIKIERPLFILGVPRSGTTFLHRTLSEDQQRFTSVTTWEVFLAPSILQKKLILALGWLDKLIGRPGARALAWLEKKLFSGLEGVHDMSLDAAEEDYLLLLPLFSCFILFLPFTESRHIWQLARFDWQASDKDKKIIMSYYKACIQKHMAVFGTNKRYLSKNAAFASWPQALHDTFPDADFVICMREPEKAVPSLLGSLRGGAEFFQLDLDSGELPEMLVSMMADYYKHLLENFPKPAPIVPMSALKADVIATVETLYQQFGTDTAPDYRRRLEQLALEAGHYQPKTATINPQSDAENNFYQHRFAGYYARLSEATGTASIVLASENS